MLRAVFQEPVTSQNMLESMLKAGTLGMQLLPRTSIKGTKNPMHLVNSVRLSLIQNPYAVNS